MSKKPMTATELIMLDRESAQRRVDVMVEAIIRQTKAMEALTAALEKAVAAWNTPIVTLDTGNFAAPDKTK